MTVKEAIDYADLMKPNAIPQAVKIRWISQLDGRVSQEIMLMAPAEMELFNYDEDQTGHTLLVDPPHDDIYPAWLQAQIDLANNEYDRASNTMQVFNAMWSRFLRWFCQLYDPIEGYETEGQYSGSWNY